MTNKDIFKIALAQSAEDCNCSPADFLKSENIVVISRKNPKARSYVPLPLACDLVTYGGNIVAQVSESLKDPVTDFLKNKDFHLFETPQLHLLDDFLSEYGLKTCYMGEYFLPDLNRFRILECRFPTKLLKREDLKALYLPEWSNALSRKENKHLDIMAVGAYDGDQLIGLAGCSKDCKELYQIGVDVLPQYRRKGIAAALTSRLASEIFKLGKIPFYCAAWSNIISMRNAVNCGFKPAWAELTARETEFVDEQKTT